MRGRRIADCCQGLLCQLIGFERIPGVGVGIGRQSPGLRRELFRPTGVAVQRGVIDFFGPQMVAAMVQGIG